MAAKSKKSAKDKAKKDKSGKGKAKKNKKQAPDEVAAKAEPNGQQVPIVQYLALGARPALKANECKSCGARFLDRRNACAGCFGTTFKSVRLKNRGTLRAYSIVHFAAPGVAVPFVAAQVDIDGTQVGANVINVDPVPENLQLGMDLKLATTSAGFDDEGTECITFGFEPV